MEVRESKWRILLPTPEDWLEVFVAKNSSCFQDAYARCRNMHLENDKVFKNVQTVFETFGIELALKLLRNDGFACRLGRVNASDEFVEKLLRVFKQYCHEKREFFDAIACGCLFAHLLDAEFFKKMDEFFAKYCGNEPALFARFACSSLFAHLFDDGFFRRLEQVRDEVFKGVQGALASAMCNLFCAALANANDEKYTSFLGRLKHIRDKFFKGDEGALATACRDPLWIRCALANRDEAFITELKKGQQNSGEQQQGQQPNPKPRQPMFRRPEPRL